MADVGAQDNGREDMVTIICELLTSIKLKHGGVQKLRIQLSSSDPSSKFLIFLLFLPRPQVTRRDHLGQV